MFQQRIFTVTDKAIYNIHNFRVKSKILIEDIMGLTKNVPSGHEFCVHLNQRQTHIELPNTITSLHAFRQALFSAGDRPVVLHFTEDESGVQGLKSKYRDSLVFDVDLFSARDVVSACQVTQFPTTVVYKLGVL